MIFLFTLAQSASAQTTAIKTNALYWATLTPNIDFETKIAKKWTMELSLGYNFISFDHNPSKIYFFDDENGTRKWKHIAVQPELRYWFCAPYAGHFLGAHLLYSHFNAGDLRLPFGIFPGLKDFRFQGDLGGAGLAYGYNHMVNQWMSLEFEIGLGLMVASYKKYDCAHCGTYNGRETKTFLAPTKVAVNAVFYLK